MQSRRGIQREVSRASASVQLIEGSAKRVRNNEADVSRGKEAGGRDDVSTASVEEERRRERRDRAEAQSLLLLGPWPGSGAWISARRAFRRRYISSAISVRHVYYYLVTKKARQKCEGNADRRGLPSIISNADSNPRQSAAGRPTGFFGLFRCVQLQLLRAVL